MTDLLSFQCQTLDALIEGGDRVCDLYDDNAQARADMHADCLGTPAHLQADLLDHFNSLLHHD